MSIGGLGLRGHLLAGLAVTGLVSPLAVSADEIRILFASSRDAGPVEAQVRKLERAIREGQGPLAVAESLSEANSSSSVRREMKNGAPSSRSS